MRVFITGASGFIGRALAERREDISREPRVGVAAGLAQTIEWLREQGFAAHA